MIKVPKKKEERGSYLNITLSDLSRYASYYRENAFVNKLSAIARSLGQFAAEQFLVLYYALTQGELSMREKLLVAAALGYFILPVDLIPDFLGPIVGFSDDLAVIAMVIRTMHKSITPAIKDKAEQRAREIFRR